MNHTTRIHKGLLLTFSAAAVAAMLTACGGGGSATSASSANSSTVIASGMANGTVTGFGSVFVDGTEIEDAKAYTRMENANGSFSNVALKLGHRVQVDHDGNLSASSVTVHSAVIGAVSALGTNEFKAAGQWVKINSDTTAAAPVTAWGGGYTGFADMLASDLVEVHGAAVYDTTRKAYVIQATRVEKKSAISAVRIMGKISALDTTAKTFSINGVTISYQSATLAPATAVLANDQVVAVWGPSGSLTNSAALTLSANRVRVMSGTKADLVTSGTGQLGGLVGNYDMTAKTLEIEGVKVSLANASVVPSGVAIANGAYVQVKGTFGTDGVLAATSVKVRQADITAGNAVIELKGAISSFVDATSFLVRGVPVDASAIDVAASCPGVTLANDVFVEIKALPQADTDVVKVTRLRCMGSPPAMGMRGAEGTAGTVDTAAKTFVLTREKSGKTQPVVWSDQTVWAGVAADTLTGKVVDVDGYLDASGNLVARGIRLEGTGDAGKYAPHREGGENSAWENYKRKFRKG